MLCTSVAQTTETKTASAEKPSSHPAIAPVDVNNADTTALQTLPGVGPAMAQRIIEGRPYKNLEELGKVKGLSKTKLAGLKNDVVFGATPSAHAVATSDKATGNAQTSEPRMRHSAASSTSQRPTPHQTPSAPVGFSEHAGGTKLAPGEKINLNTATAEQLDALPGIGPTKARAIVDYRTQNGNFKTIEDIEKVRGIKGGIFSKIKDQIKVTD